MPTIWITQVGIVQQASKISLLYIRGLVDYLINRKVIISESLLLSLVATMANGEQKVEITHKIFLTGDVPYYQFRRIN